jgi:hypothetical protein
MPRWAPRENWGFSFGARAGARAVVDEAADDNSMMGGASYSSVARVRIERGAAVESSLVGLHISGNGQQFQRAGNYGYHAHPHVQQLTPTVGFAAGGTALTLSGVALGGAQAYLCRFMMGFDPAIETIGHFDEVIEGVRCPAPTRAEYDRLVAPWSPPHQALYTPNASYRPVFNLSLRLWRDGFAYLPRSRSTFTLTPPPGLASALPASGPVHGGTRIHVRGLSLSGGWRYSCRFAPPNATEPPPDAVDLIRQVRARFTANIGAVRCTSPRSPRVVRSTLHTDYDTYGKLEADLSVSLNTADYDEGVNVPFEFYDPPGGLSLSNVTGPVLGGTPIVISGANLTGGSDRRCRFIPVVFGIPSPAARRTAWGMKVEVAASVHRADHLRCVTPALPERVAQVTVEVALNGQQFTHEGHRFALTARQGAPPLDVPEGGGWAYPVDALMFVPDRNQLDPGSPVFLSELPESPVADEMWDDDGYDESRMDNEDPTVQINDMMYQREEGGARRPSPIQQEAIQGSVRRMPTDVPARPSSY